MRTRLLGWARQVDAASANTIILATRLTANGSVVPAVPPAWSVLRALACWPAQAGHHCLSPAQYPYRDGVWHDPLIVLADQEIWSAAQEVAAVLQDDRAALITLPTRASDGAAFKAKLLAAAPPDAITRAMSLAR